MHFRRPAVAGYLQCADAQETKDMLARLLVGDMGFNIHNTYFHAIGVLDNTEDNTEKREAIIDVVADALMETTDKQTFEVTDKLLAERSKEYAESPQRKAARQRFNIPPIPPDKAASRAPYLLYAVIALIPCLLITVYFIRRKKSA